MLRQHVVLAVFFLAAGAAGAAEHLLPDTPASSASFETDLALASKASKEAQQNKIVEAIIGAVKKLGHDAAAKQSHTNANMHAEEAKMDRIMKDEQQKVKTEEEAMEVNEEEGAALLTIGEWPNLSADKGAKPPAKDDEDPIFGPTEEDAAEDDLFHAEQDEDSAEAEEAKAAHSEAKATAASNKASHALAVMTESKLDLPRVKKAVKPASKHQLRVIKDEASRIIDHGDSPHDQNGSVDHSTFVRKIAKPREQEDEETKDEDMVSGLLHSEVHVRTAKETVDLPALVKADLKKHPHKGELRVAKLKHAMAAAIKDEQAEADEDEKAEEEAEGSEGEAAQRSSTTRDKEGAEETEVDLLKSIIKDPHQDEATFRDALSVLLQGV